MTLIFPKRGTELARAKCPACGKQIKITSCAEKAKHLVYGACQHTNEETLEPCRYRSFYGPEYSLKLLDQWRKMSGHPQSTDLDAPRPEAKPKPARKIGLFDED